MEKALKRPDAAEDLGILVKMDFTNDTRWLEFEKEITEYWIYTYDEKGNLLRKARYDAEDNLSYYNEFTWDDTGMVKTEMSYNADGTPANHFDVFTYDEYGNQIMQERYRDGEVYWRISYVYEMLEAGK